MRKVAGLLTVRNYKEDCSVFESLRTLTDFTIVLDDNSRFTFPHRDECDEYLSLTNRAQWNDIANRTLLMQRAYFHECEWVVCSDDDIIFSHNFQTRKDVDRVIRSLEAENKDTGRFLLRDLWNSVSQYRSDGVWGRKTFVVLRKNWFFSASFKLPAPSSRLHRPVYPAKQKQQVAILRECVAYHTGCFTETDRITRVEKYAQVDPKHEFQDDYSYMLNTDGLVLADGGLSIRLMRM